MQDRVRFTTRHAIDPDAAARMGTEGLRAQFHIGGLFEPGHLHFTYTHYDRMIVGGVVPMSEPVPLATIKPTGTQPMSIEARVSVRGTRPKPVQGRKYRLKVTARRYLTEVRDNYLYRFPKLTARAQNLLRGER